MIVRHHADRNRGVLLAVAVLAVGLIQAGCQDQFGKPGSRSGLQPGFAGGGTEDQTDSSHKESGPRKRFCAVYLLNTSIEEGAGPGQKDKAGENPVPAEGRLPLAVRKYKQLHDDMPAAVVEAMARCNLRNYSVYVGAVRGEYAGYYAVRYFEYVGTDPEVDFRMLARDPAFRRWQEECEACQVVLLPVTGEPLGPFMEQIFHNDLLPRGKPERQSPADPNAPRSEP